MRPVPRLVLVAPLAAVLAGCFTTARDFRDDAEDFLASDADLHEQLGVAGLSNVVCDEPENQAQGTTFRCTATDGRGRAWEFEGEILDGDEYRIEVRRAP